MPLDIGLWRLTDGAPKQIAARPYPLEAQLEDLLAQDPTLVGEPLLLVGRQVPTSYGGFIDLLAIDADGYICVLELKRDRTPREVVAQLLDYARRDCGGSAPPRTCSRTPEIVAARPSQRRVPGKSCVFRRLAAPLGNPTTRGSRAWRASATMTIE